MSERGTLYENLLIVFFTNNNINIIIIMSYRENVKIYEKG